MLIRATQCLRLIIVCGALSVIVSGCGVGHHATTAPEGARASDAAGAKLAADRAETPPSPSCETAGGREIYPLESGNRWRHMRRFVVVMIPDHGDSQTVFDERWSVEREQTCEQSLGGRDYLAERAISNAPGGPWRWWLLLRQDATGLYETDPPLTEAPACEGAAPVTAAGGADPIARAERAWRASITRMAAPQVRAAWQAAWQRHREKLAALAAALGERTAPGGRRRGPALPPEGELLRLRYPLHVGARWVTRIDPRFTSRVERIESLELPAGRFRASRIRIASDFLGPQDRVFVWYGRDGFLKLDDHFESEAVDAEGNPIGRVVSEEREVMVDIALKGSPRFATRMP